MENILKCIPVFISNSIEYFKEDDGVAVFTSKRHPELRNLQVNSQAKDILEHSNGTNTVEDIAKAIACKYADVDYDIVVKDIEQIIPDFWRLGIIEWKGTNPYESLLVKETNGTSCEILSEEKAVNILTKTQEYQVYPILNKRYCLDKVNVSQRAFFGFEQYCNISSDNIDILYGLSFKNNKSKSCYINFYKIACNEYRPEIRELLDWSIKRYINLVKTKLFRVDALIAKELLADEEYYVSINLLKNLGFKKSGVIEKYVLIDENYHDVELYSLQV